MKSFFLFKNKRQVKDVTFCTRIDLAVWLELYSSSGPQRYRANLASDFNSAIFLSKQYSNCLCWPYGKAHRTSLAHCGLIYLYCMKECKKMR